MLFFRDHMIHIAPKKITVTAPKKGKVVSRKKFLEIQRQKSYEMISKFKTRKDLNLGNGLNIKIGGWFFY